ncbi:MAG: hypothetical protein GTO14_24280 [Anaerolineales bacterium]|nr:hypothetical protein [Anaerolineales bacterium]
MVTEGSHYVRNLALTAVLGSLVGILVLIVVLARMQLDALISPNPSIPAETPADYGLAYWEISLETEDGLRLAAWYLPALEGNGTALVLVHGMGANRAALLPTAAILSQHGYSLVLIDLRSHGQSQGDWVSYGYYEGLDVLAAVEFLVEEKGFGRERIGFLGVSLGGAAVIRAASLSDVPHVLVVVSTFHSLPAAIEDGFNQVSALPRWPFAPLVVGLAERRFGLGMGELDLVAMMSRFSPRPVLLIHGAEDGVIPIHHHQALHMGASGMAESWVVVGMGHEDPAHYDPVAFERRLISFLDRALLGRDSQGGR